MSLSHKQPVAFTTNGVILYRGVPAALVISSQVIADKNSSSASVPVELIFTTFPVSYSFLRNWTALDGLLSA